MECRVCGSEQLEPVVDLGKQPWGNNFLGADQVGKEPFYPLVVVFCVECHTAQLDYTVPKETMFLDHTYVSGTTASLRAHFRATAEKVNEKFSFTNSPPSILDIGSNDGTQLQEYQALGYQVVGVESSRNIADMANAAGVPTVAKFFNEETARELGQQFDVINASGVFFHLEELHSVCEGIRISLAPNGVFVVQFIYIKLMQENVAFDQIYHEHLLYYSLESVQNLLGRHGLEMFDAEVSPIHGGSVIGFVGHAGAREQTQHLRDLRAAEDAAGTNSLECYRQFAEAAAQSKANTRAWFAERIAEGKVIFGLGAPVKGNTLMNYYELGPDEIQCLVERNPLRKGLFSPGAHIPIKLEEELDGPPDAYLVLAWNFKKEILERHAADVAAGVEFYFPVDPAEH
ncbi:MAG: class I SAM-dependent methyltransferase [Actinomycetota bacterium]|nr:class I SAM-dependent methyltransferase [Actinomycetota bacterium]